MRMMLYVRLRTKCTEKRKISAFFPFKLLRFFYFSLSLTLNSPLHWMLFISGNRTKHLFLFSRNWDTTDTKNGRWTTHWILFMILFRIFSRLFHRTPFTRTQSRSFIIILKLIKIFINFVRIFHSLLFSFFFDSLIQTRNLSLFLIAD